MKKKTLFIILGILVAVLILGSMTNLTDKLKGDKDDDDTTAAVTTTEAPTAYIITTNSNGDPVVYSSLADFNVPSLGEDHIVNTMDISSLSHRMKHNFSGTTTSIEFTSLKVSDSSDNLYHAGFKISSMYSDYRYVLKIKLRDDSLNNFIISPSVSLDSTDYSGHFNSAIPFIPVGDNSEMYLYFVPDNKQIFVDFITSTIDPSTDFVFSDHIDLYLYEIPNS